MLDAATPDRRILSAEELVAELARGGSAVVALSGGVDSAVVASLAFRALGPDAHAVTFHGAAVARSEVESARAVAKWIGLPHALLESDPLRSESYRANPSNRCYFCRSGEAALLSSWAAERGIDRLLDGVHVDDLGDVRPGLQALREAGVRHPLVEAGWRKADVRDYARRIGLPNHDRPSEACLASRVRHGEPISAELLDRVARSEAFVSALGFRRVRVRVEGRAARIEVGPDEVARLVGTPLADRLREELGALGFEGVTIDPRGYGWRPAA